MQESGVRECRHLHRDAGVQEYCSADICIGMQECRSTAVQTFASGCRGLECGSADISLSHNLLLTPRSPFLILNS